MHDINDLERRGIPGVFTATVEFSEAARIQSEALGLDVARVLTPHPIQDRTDEEMTAIADQVIDKLIAAITASP